MPAAIAGSARFSPDTSGGAGLPNQRRPHIMADRLAQTVDVGQTVSYYLCYLPSKMPEYTTASSSDNEVRQGKNYQLKSDLSIGHLPRPAVSRFSDKPGPETEPRFHPVQALLLSETTQQQEFTLVQTLRNRAPGDNRKRKRWLKKHSAKEFDWITFIEPGCATASMPCII